MEILNAKITGATLGEMGRGFTSMLDLDYGGSGQGFGGYALRGATTDKWIRGVLKTLELEAWEDLKGTACRARIEDGMVSAIGHYLKDQWFTPKTDLA